MTNDSPVPRRMFLTSCSAAGAVGVASTLTPSQSQSPGRDVGPSLEDFERQIGTSFVVDSEEGDRVRMKLVEVTPSKFPPAPVGRKHPFSVVFRVSGDRLSQDVYTVRHPRFKPARHLFVPVFSRNEQCLEVVFG